MTYAAIDIPLFTSESSDQIVHVVMPNMAYACGGSILDGGRIVIGPSRWAEVTCLDCLGCGQAALAAECQRMQREQADVR